jgi:hypothetical protein
MPMAQMPPFDDLTDARAKYVISIANRMSVPKKNHTDCAFGTHGYIIINDARILN